MPTRPRVAQKSPRRYRRSSQGYGYAWSKLSAFIIGRDPICTVPGCTKPSTQADHIIARRKGGTDDPENLRGMCHPHHARKTAMEDGGFGNKPGLAVSLEQLRASGSKGRRRWG
jgi:5-methylcytosine-specific restriction endonuclease McrA